MNQIYTTIDYDALTATTGDPFVDAAGYALKELSTHYPNYNILELIMLATNIYVDNWDAKINPFFLNSKITQPAFNTSERKKKETRMYFEGLLNETSPYIIGHCRITGRKTKLFPAGRDNTVLSGSNTFVNFHHTFDTGMMLSKETLIRYHFLPLACELLQGRICVISSNCSKTSELYAKDCCNRTLYDIGQNCSQGILKNEARSPGTAIFRYLDKVLRHYTIDTVNESITLYLFTNFGASPEAQIYTLPFQALSFYQETQRPLYEKTWNIFIAAHYRCSDYKNATYDKKQNTFIATNKKQNIIVEEADFKYWRNIIYDKLLLNKSIVSDIRKWSIQNLFDLNLLKCYLINIRNMKKETIEKINQIADFILSNNAESKMKKVLSTLNGVKNPYMLRRFILHVITENYKQENDMLVSVNDYVDYLFPDSNSWMETRDVLLIAIYQKLHELHLKIEVEDTEDEIDGFHDDINL
ncbi:hypothetical protein [Bacteroides sp.]